MAEQLEKGTVIPDGAVPANQGQFTHRSRYGRGGLHTGDAYQGRVAVDALPVERREWGMEVKTLEGERYELVRGLSSQDLADNANWQPLVLGAAVATTYLADTDIPIGRLVARTATGIVPYDAKQLSARHTLLGVALQSASAGGTVRVQVEPGTVTIPGYGLAPGTVYQAGAGGQLVTSATGLAFQQLIGRALSADSLYFSPSPLITL